MKKTKKTLAVVLALVIALSAVFFSGSVISAGAAGGTYSFKPGDTKLVTTEYNSNATVTLGWSKANNAGKYQIAKKKAGDKNYTYLYSTTNTYNDKNVVCGVVYYYQIRAIKEIKEAGTGKVASTLYGNWSNSKSLTTLYRPTITSMNWMTNMLNINWNAIRGTTKYQLAFKRTTDKNWNYRETTSRYFNIPNPTKGAEYVAQVCPMNGSVKGPWSMPPFFSIEEKYAKPVFGYVGNDHIGGWYETEILIEWTYNGKQVKGYTLYYKTKAAAKWSSVKVPAEKTQYGYHLDNVLPFDTDCFFQLRAYNASGQPIGQFSDVYAYRTNVYYDPNDYYM